MGSKLHQPWSAEVQEEEEEAQTAGWGASGGVTVPVRSSDHVSPTPAIMNEVAVLVAHITEQVTTLLLGQDDMRSLQCDVTRASGLGSVCSGVENHNNSRSDPRLPSQQAGYTPGVGPSVGWGRKPDSETRGPTV